MDDGMLHTIAQAWYDGILRTRKTKTTLELIRNVNKHGRAHREMEKDHGTLYVDEYRNVFIIIRLILISGLVIMDEPLFIMTCISLYIIRYLKMLL